MPIKVDGQDADRARRDGRLDLLRIQAIALVDIHKDRLGAPVNHRLDRGEGGVRRDNDFVARLSGPSRGAA